PSSTQYDLLEPEDIAIVDLDGNLIDGRRSPTSEVQMHTLYCTHRPEIGGIVHTHGKAVMTLATMNWTLPPILTRLCQATRRGAPLGRSRTGSPPPRTRIGATGALPSCSTTACWPSARTSTTRSTPRLSSKAHVRSTWLPASSARFPSYRPPRSSGSPRISMP